MKILHLASFSGNIGDHASHYGTYKLLKKYIYCEIDRLEIRKFYKKYDLPDKQHFDKQFASLANKYDLLLIGGGGYLDYFLDSSSNGTTLDISEEVLDRIEVPILICSMGCLPRGGEHNYPKVRKFLNVLKDKAHILLRNDGSHKWFPDFPHVADSGIFYENEGLYRLVDDYVAINVSTDLTGKPDLLISEIAKFVDSVDDRIVFVPHIHSDLQAITDVLDRVHYWKVATRITVAPYLQERPDQMFSVYKNSKQVIACRYHANLCSIAIGKPCVGIEVSEKVRELYQSFGSEAVKVETGFSGQLIKRFGETFDTTEQRVRTEQIYDDTIIDILGAGL